LPELWRGWLQKLFAMNLAMKRLTYGHMEYSFGSY